MKTVILCGGLGTRLREETEFRPKPMVVIGGKPILWHIMRTYSFCATEPHDPSEIVRMDLFYKKIPYNWDIKHG